MSLFFVFFWPCTSAHSSWLTTSSFRFPPARDFSETYPTLAQGILIPGATVFFCAERDRESINHAPPPCWRKGTRARPTIHDGRHYFLTSYSMCRLLTVRHKRMLAYFVIVRRKDGTRQRDVLVGVSTSVSDATRTVDHEALRVFMLWRRHSTGARHVSRSRLSDRVLCAVRGR